LGASAEEAPTSPPVALRWLKDTSAYPSLHHWSMRYLDWGRFGRVEVEIEGKGKKILSTHIILISLGSNFGAVRDKVSWRIII
jgi:hypothetical protein